MPESILQWRTKPNQPLLNQMAMGSEADRLTERQLSTRQARILAADRVCSSLRD